jgi:hypothetical protein
MLGCCDCDDGVDGGGVGVGTCACEGPAPPTPPEEEASATAEAEKEEALGELLDATDDAAVSLVLAEEPLELPQGDRPPAA